MVLQKVIMVQKRFVTSLKYKEIRAKQLREKNREKLKSWRQKNKANSLVMRSRFGKHNVVEEPGQIDKRRAKDIIKRARSKLNQAIQYSNKKKVDIVHREEAIKARKIPRKTWNKFTREYENAIRDTL